ncbi:MAG TPA: hypothetical protein VKN14_14510 [Flavobacteriaceae bacterium]|nr:hypothetical protein [Flavobacteriaceae bacterium]
MKFRILIFVFLSLLMNKSYSQPLLDVEKTGSEFNLNKTQFLLVAENNNEITYQVCLISKEIKSFDFNINLRVEDELTSEEQYNLLKDISFFDVSISYQLGSFSISTSIENTLNFNNDGFAIEPSLERQYNVIDEVSFAHEADFVINTAITFNF